MFRSRVSSPCAPCLCSCRTGWCSWGLMSRTRSDALRWAAQCSGWLAFLASAARQWLRKTSDSSASPMQSARLAAVIQRKRQHNQSLQRPASCVKADCLSADAVRHTNEEFCELSTYTAPEHRRIWYNSIKTIKKFADMLVWISEDIILITYRQTTSPIAAHRDAHMHVICAQIHKCKKGWN